MVKLEGLEQPVAPGSTIGGCLVVNCIKAEVAKRLIEAGQPPKALAAAAILGSERAAEVFEAAYDEHAHRLARLFAEVGTEVKVSSDIPTVCEADIVVVGAGSAGCCAAIAAAEMGRSVVLIERYGFAGGTSTQILDTFYGFFTPGEEPRKVVGGIPDRVVDALDLTGDIFLRPNTYGAGTGVTYNPERLKLVWDRLLLGAGVKMLLHAWLCDVEVGKDGRIFGVIVHTKRGFLRVKGSDLLTPAAMPICAISQALLTKRQAISIRHRRSRPPFACQAWTSTGSKLRVERKCLWRRWPKR